MKIKLTRLVFLASLIAGATPSQANPHVDNLRKNLIGTFAADAQACKRGYPVQQVRFGSGDSLLVRGFDKGSDGKPSQVYNNTMKNFRISEKGTLVYDVEVEWLSGKEKGKVTKTKDLEMIVTENYNKSAKNAVTWYNCSNLAKGAGSTPTSKSSSESRAGSGANTSDNKQRTSLVCRYDDGRIETLVVDDARKKLRWGNAQDYDLDEIRPFTWDESGRKIPAKVFYYEDRVFRGGWTELIVTDRGIRFVSGPLGNPNPFYWQKGSCTRK